MRKIGDRMNYRASVFLILLLGVGLLAAILPANGWNVKSTGKYTVPTVQANHTTEGGNVTNMDLSQNATTTKWAGYWGNVSGNIFLGQATSVFYKWKWAPANGGVVCAVAAPSGFNWATVQSVVAAVIDTIWNFGTATDNAANTLTQSSCNVKIGDTTVSSVGNTTGVGGFQTCAVADSAAPAAKSDLAFCVNISAAGNLFNGQTGNYELLVPTNRTVGTTETYYFWMEMR
ncbi:MAG: hypothetical protein N3G76_01600 [Candidatus Micrarchaeota archaeon]|nr:hypothetical protein [Candidatus Micrarchaeota archaeon]